MHRRHILAAVLCAAAAGGAFAGETVSRAQDGWDFSLDGAAITAVCDESLARAREQFAAIESASGAANLDSVYGPYQVMNLGLQRIQHVWYMSAVHPDPGVQAAAEACIEAYSDFKVTTDLSQAFYRRVAAIDLEGATAAERLMIERKLRDFRKAGVDRDQATRDRVRKLIAEITALGTEFDRNIRTDRRVVMAKPGQLDGLPDDYLAARPPNAAGEVPISTDYPDYMPVMTYANDDDLRRSLYVAARSIGTPANEAVLKALLERRFEFARLLGYDSYAALAMDGLMIGSPANAQAFLDEVGAAVKAPARRDMKQLLERLRRDEPDAEVVEVWQSFWLSNLVREEEYALDAREVREYFHFDRVQDGLFQLTEDLFGVEIVRWDTDTWHEDVTAWEMRDGGEAIGRFYLDMHPRENKYKHAAHWTLRTGIRDMQVPLSGMATNFPRGLMEHRQVETFLHEFGHLLHNMFSGTQAWLDISGMSMERDFVEAPSQMLEEWVWDYETLARFARNRQGETIPSALVAKMQRARHHGKGARTAQQVFYGNLALNLYSREPDSFELLPLTRELQVRFSPYPYVPGTYFYNNFGHLNGYSSNYYIYQWSLAISTDLMEPFARGGLRNTAVAASFREKVLASAGSRPADEMLEDFLGRPFSTDAYKKFLKGLN